MIKIPVFRFKSLSLTVSGIIFTTSLVMPLTAVSDTSSSVDAIMEQLKTIKATPPRTVVANPVVVIEDDDEEEKIEVEEKVEVVEKIEKKEPEPEVVRVEEKAVVFEEKKPEPKVEAVVEQKVEERIEIKPVQAIRIEEAPSEMVVKAKKKPRIKKLRKKRVKKRSYKRKRIAKPVQRKALEPEMLVLLNQLVDDDSSTATSILVQQAMQVLAMPVAKEGISGWVYLGRFRGGLAQNNSTLSSGKSLPVVGQQYAVQSMRLNMRKSRSAKGGGLGKLVKVLHAGEKIIINNIHRSSRNNYWAHVSR